jgi:hypothetical protein
LEIEPKVRGVLESDLFDFDDGRGFFVQDQVFRRIFWTGKSGPIFYGFPF